MAPTRTRLLTVSLIACGIAAVVGLAIGLAQIWSDRRTLTRSVDQQRSLLSARAASALASELQACRAKLESRGAAWHSPVCMGGADRPVPIRWFGWSDEDQHKGLSPDRYRQQRSRLASAAKTCAADARACLPLAADLGRLGPDLDPLVTAFGVEALPRLASGPASVEAKAALRRRLEQALFNDTIRRHYSEIASTEPGRWLRIGRYRLTRPGNPASPGVIGFDAQPEPGRLHAFLVHQNVFDGDPYEFRLVPPDQQPPLETPGESLAFVHSLLGTMVVADPLAPQRVSTARANADQALLWMGLAGLILILALWLLHRSTRLALANVQMRENFIASVSHEFRTPLGGLGLMIDTLRQGKITDQGRQREYLDQMGRETHRLSRLAENILALGRLQRRPVEGAATWSPQRVWAQVAEQLLPELGDRVTLHPPDPERLPTGRGDPDLIQIAWLNLIDNAVKYSPADAPVDVHLEADAGRIRLRVEDRGPGIPHSQRDKVFEWFHRSAQGSDGPRAPGSGLGLALVRQVAELYGGSVQVSQRPGGGARFDLSIPEAGGRA